MAGQREVRRHLVGRRAVVAGAAALPLLSIGRGYATEAPIKFALTPVVLDSSEPFHTLFRSVLERRLGRPVELVQRRSYQEITTLLLAGQIDAAWICGYPYVQFADRLTLLAVPVYKGRPLYQSYLVSNRDHPATTLEELRGDIHAFSDPDSNSGHLVTRYLLAVQGETPASFFRETFFTYGHRNVVRAVAAGLADSGSAEGYVWDVLSEIEPELTEACHVVAKSEWLGFPPITALSTRGEEPEIRGIAEALVGLEDSEDGRALLELLRFDRFTAVTPDNYARIAELSRFVESQS
jgi:phosphonate transport system substrate-binding protein